MSRTAKQSESGMTFETDVITGEALSADGGETLKASVERQIEAEQLQKKIAALEAKIRRERQPRKKFTLLTYLNQLKQGLHKK